MFSRFHKEISAQDPENVKWDVDDLSQSHRSRKVAQLLRFLVSCELGRVAQERRKTTAKFVAGIFRLFFLISPPVTLYRSAHYPQPGRRRNQER